MKRIDCKTALETFVAKHPSQRDAAVALGVSQAYLSDILRGNRRCSDGVLSKLGLERVIVKAAREAR